jgi:hypothetical protein
LLSKLYVSGHISLKDPTYSLLSIPYKTFSCNISAHCVLKTCFEKMLDISEWRDTPEI